MRAFQNSLAEIVFDTLETTTVSEVILQALRTRCFDNHSYRNNFGNWKPEALIPSVTPRYRALCRFLRSRPNPHNTQFQVVNKLVTLQQITDIPQQQKKRYTKRLQRVKNTTYTVQRAK